MECEHVSAGRCMHVFLGMSVQRQICKEVLCSLSMWESLAVLSVSVQGAHFHLVRASMFMI